MRTFSAHFDAARKRLNDVFQNIERVQGLAKRCEADLADAQRLFAEAVKIQAQQLEEAAKQK